MRHVGQQRAERDDELRAERLGEVDDQRQNVRQRIDGSGPWTSTRSRGRAGTRAAKISTAGQVISRVRPSVKPICGRVAWKSKNSSGSMRAKRSAPSDAPTNVSAAEAASPASFQPLKAHDQRGGAQAVGTALPDQWLHPIQGTSWAVN